MELSPQQNKEFAELHKGYLEFSKYSADEVREIANGVASYYRTLFTIYRILEKEGVKPKIINCRQKSNLSDIIKT